MILKFLTNLNTRDNLIEKETHTMFRTKAEPSEIIVQRPTLVLSNHYVL